MVSLVGHILERGHVWPSGLCPFSSVVSFCKVVEAHGSFLLSAHVPLAIDARKFLSPAQ